MFLDHNSIKLEINCKKISRKPTKSLELMQNNYKEHICERKN